MSATTGNSQYAPGASAASDGAAGEQPESAQQHRARAEAVDREAGDELRDAARGVEHADQHAEQRPRHVELGAQQREQRRQRELEEVREGVGDADEADDADVAAERLGAAVSKTRDGNRRCAGAV